MKKIVIMVVLVVVLIVLAFLAKKYVFYDKYEMPEGAFINIDMSKIDVYSTKKLYDLFEKYNVEILSEDQMLDTNTIGEHVITIRYRYDSKIKIYLYDVKYIVKDDIAPIFITGLVSSKKMYIEDENDVNKVVNKITYGDNYDVKPSLKIDHDIDFKEIGKYKITLTLSDSSNNETIKTINVIMVSKEEEKQRENEKNDEDEIEDEERDELTFSKFLNENKAFNNLLGIDISKWQGKVDFEKVKEEGCDFVIIRMGVMKTKDDPLVLDNTFEENYKNAKKAGLKVGVYVYSEANNVKTAVENADFVVEALNGDKLDFPVAFDWESWSYFNDMDINIHMLNAMYDAFSKRLEESGYETMLYGSQSYLNNVWMDISNYKLWVARYSNESPKIINGEYIMWQKANTGLINGIDGEVDFDIYYINK